MFNIEQIEQVRFEAIRRFGAVHGNKRALPPPAQDVNPAGKHFSGFLVSSEKHARIGSDCLRKV